MMLFAREAGERSLVQSSLTRSAGWIPLTILTQVLLAKPRFTLGYILTPASQAKDSLLHCDT